MEPITIDATKSSPFVLIDPAAHLFQIKGESYPENAAKFFGPVLSFINEYLYSSGTSRITIDMQLTYFNSSSSKVLLNLFESLEKAVSEGKDVIVNWWYHPENEILLEAGEEFQNEFPSLPFKFIEIFS
ncbi:MAG: DUF1987 domain-containing protein [Desulfomonilaceae bacterium]